MANEHYYLELGTLIKEKRNDAGLDQHDLATRLGVSDNTISRWETGFSKPSSKKIKKICDVLKCDYDSLVFLATERSAQAKQGDIQNLVSDDFIRIPLYDSMRCDKPFTNEGLNQFISISSYLLDKDSKYFAFTCKHNTLNFSVGDVLIFEQSSTYNDADIICACVKNKPNVLMGYMNRLFGCKVLGVLRRAVKNY